MINELHEEEDDDVGTSIVLGIRNYFPFLLRAVASD